MTENVRNPTKQSGCRTSQSHGYEKRQEHNQTITRQEALEELRHYGIEGPQVYLIDCISLRGSLMAACMDIASSCVVHYPFGGHERFSFEEKRCFFEILESLEAL